MTWEERRQSGKGREEGKGVIVVPEFWKSAQSVRAWIYRVVGIGMLFLGKLLPGIKHKRYFCVVDNTDADF